MKLRRILTIREVLLSIALVAALLSGVAGYAQGYRPVQSPDGISSGRLQRQIDALEAEARTEQKATAQQLADLRQELAVFRAELATINRLGWGLLTGLSGLIVQALWGVIAAKRAKD